MRDNGDYSINSEGRDSSNWSSRPASDRIDKFGSDRRNTEDVYNECGCNQPISEADREKRVEELDELIHDNIGDEKYDEDVVRTSDIRSEYNKDQDIATNKLTDTPSAATTANNLGKAAGVATGMGVGEQTPKEIADDCSSDMSIQDLASYSDAHNGLSDNDDIIIIEQVDIEIIDPENNDTRAEK